MSLDPTPQPPASPDDGPFSPIEAHALDLAQDLRDRVARERETVRLLRAHIERSAGARRHQR